MLEDYRKLLEQNYLYIIKLEKKIEEITNNISKGEELIGLYEIIIERQKEKKKNKKCLFGAVEGFIFFIITIIIFPYLGSLMGNFRNNLALIFTFMTGGIELICFYSSSRECKYSLDDIIAKGIITKEEVEELLKKNKFYFDFKEYEIGNKIAIKKEQISSFEREKNCLLEENSRIRKALELKEQVLNDRLIGRELMSEFDNFLEEKPKIEDIHLYNYDEPIKLTFTNK